MGWCWRRSCRPIPTFVDGSWICLRRPPLLPTGSRRPDSTIGQELFPAASSIPCRRGPTPVFCPTSCAIWDDEHARTILGGCRQAAAPNGTVVVIEPVRGQGAGTAMDLFMLMCFGGRERTVDELAGLAADSGLVLHGAGPVAEGRTALEFGVAFHESG